MNTYLITVAVSGYQKFLVRADTDDEDLLVALIRDDNKADEYLEFNEVEQVDQKES